MEICLLCSALQFFGSALRLLIDFLKDNGMGERQQVSEPHVWPEIMDIFQNTTQYAAIKFKMPQRRRARVRRKFVWATIGLMVKRDKSIIVADLNVIRQGWMTWVKPLVRTLQSFSVLGKAFIEVAKVVFLGQTLTRVWKMT